MESSTTTPAESTLPEINWEELAEAASTIRKLEREIMGRRVGEGDPTRAADLARFEQKLEDASDALFDALNTANSYLNYPGSEYALRNWRSSPDGTPRDAD